MKIVVLDGYTENPGDLSWDKIAVQGDFSVYDRTPPEKTASRIGDAECIFTNKTLINKEIIDKCPSLKFVGVLATGYNVVDTVYARQKNITVSNIPTYGTMSVAQFVFALLLEICHHTAHHDKAVKEGKWSDCIDFCFWDYPLIELAGKTLGIIGLGRIGKAVAKIADAMGMKVIAYDRAENAGEGCDFCRCVSMDEVLSDSDIISLHCPLFPSTERLIRKETISKMKDGVIVINTSRGGLIDELDLKEALDTGKVYAAASDVVSTEPIKKDNPLLTAKNMIITPHIAWAPKEARQRLMDIAAQNLEAFIKGSPINVVN